MTSTLDKIENFVASLAEQAAKPDTELGLKIEAAKVLSSYYGALKKAQAQTDEGTEDEEITISGLQSQLARVTEAQHGGTVPRHKRRTRNSDAN